MKPRDTKRESEGERQRERKSEGRREKKERNAK